MRHFGISLGILVFSFLVWADANQTRKAGDQAPYFSVTTEQGQQITPEMFGGKLLVLNFWETSCVPCVKELPSLTDFAQAFRSQGVVVLAVGGDEDLAKYRHFLAEHHVALETYRDPSRRISKSFGTLMFPETYVIQHGRIIRKVIGGTDWMNNDMSSFVRAQLAHQ